MGCVFCDIVTGRAPAEVVYEDEETLAFMDINPVNPGHVLVVPKRHVRDIYALDDETAAAVMRTAIRVARAVKKALAPDGVNLFQTNEPAAFQSVFHFHMHIIPRWWDDGILPPRRGRKLDAVLLDEAPSRIRLALQNTT